MHRTAGLWLPLCGTPLFPSRSSLHFPPLLPLFSIPGVFSFYSLSLACAAHRSPSITTLTPSLSPRLYQFYSLFNSLDLTHSIFPPCLLIFFFSPRPLSFSVPLTRSPFFFSSSSFFLIFHFLWSREKKVGMGQDSSTTVPQCLIRDVWWCSQSLLNHHSAIDCINFQGGYFIVPVGKRACAQVLVDHFRIFRCR